MFTVLATKLSKISRIKKQIIMIFVDSISVLLMLFSSFPLRLGYWYWPKEDLLWFMFGAPFIAIPIFMSFRLYQSITRYIGLKDLLSVVQAVTLYAVIWGLVGYMAALEGIPRSVILINWMLCLIVISGFRLIARWFFSDKNQSEENNVIIYGAGSAGMQLSNSLQLLNEYIHVAYVDDDESLAGNYVNGIPVFSASQIISLVQKYNAKEVFIALPSISRKKRYQIIKRLASLSVHVLSLPSVSELAGGKVKIEDLREINIKDLLGREPVKPNQNLLKIKITGKVVLVTGAGGSIGAELCRQIILLKPKQLILYEISESSLYQIEQELRNLGIHKIVISPVIGSVRDFQRMKYIFKHYRVQTIYHAAAYKHVPLVEFNQSQGVLNNSIGTKLAAEAAIAENVETFVLISTDKAVRPTSTMGVTKRVAELVLQALAKTSHNTCLTMVRFGNVLGSSGSVIPLFKNQIKQGGPITVTDINMVRYFMTIPEAVELVIQAGAMGKGGDVFVLDMGEPVKIYDLALNMIKLSGLQVVDDDNPDGDIKIKYTGLRPGEKLYEELLVGDNVSATENKLIMSAQEKMIDWDTLKPMLNELEKASLNSKVEKTRDLLTQIVPEFNPNSHAIN